jgi:hypothetical protein
MCGSSVNYPVLLLFDPMIVHQIILTHVYPWEFLPHEKPGGFSRLQNLTKFFMPAY